MKLTPRRLIRVNTVCHLQVRINMAGYLAFDGLVWTVEDAAKKTIVDEKLYVSFQETENGGFRKRISVDRTL